MSIPSLRRPGVVGVVSPRQPASVYLAVHKDMYDYFSFLDIGHCYGDPVHEMRQFGAYLTFLRKERNEKKNSTEKRTEGIRKINVNESCVL